MKTVALSDLKGTEREVHCPNRGFISYRFLLEEDLMGFTLTRTVVFRGKELQRWHYKEHLEACYCVEGRGILINRENGRQYEILPDTLYVLDRNDDHLFGAITDTVTLICVFNPPLYGGEVHDEDGSY
jgi:L-ectoine synthase